MININKTVSPLLSNINHNVNDTMSTSNQADFSSYINFSDELEKKPEINSLNNKTQDISAKSLFFTQMFGEKIEEEVTTQSVADEFLEFMQKTPEERMWEQYLEQKGITPEEFANMSEEEREKIIAEFKEKIEEKIKQITGINIL